MGLAFILRFQEPCEDFPRTGTAFGTHTVTKILTEQNDMDSQPQPYRFVPAADTGTGTVTTTRIAIEQGDADRHSAPNIIPLMGTTTKTAIKVEADDQDPRRHELSILPTCCSS